MKTSVSFADAWLSTYPFRQFAPTPFFKHFIEEKPMTTKLSVFSADDAPEPEVCLAMMAKGTGLNQRVLIHIVNPATGAHVNGGNLMSIYPDGTFKLIPGCNFGGNRGGFTQR